MSQLARPVLRVQSERLERLDRRVHKAPPVHKDLPDHRVQLDQKAIRAMPAKKVTQVRMAQTVLLPMLAVMETGSSEITTLVFPQLALLVVKVYPVRPVKMARTAYLQPIAGTALF